MAPLQGSQGFVYRYENHLAVRARAALLSFHCPGLRKMNYRKGLFNGSVK